MLKSFFDFKVRAYYMGCVERVDILALLSGYLGIGILLS